MKVNYHYRIVIILILLLSNLVVLANNKADPFTPYLTGKPPVIVEDLGTETRTDGIKVHRFVYLSRTIDTQNGKEPSHVYAAIAYPARNDKFPGLLRLHGGGGIADIESAVSSAKKGYVSLVLDIPGVSGNSRNEKNKGAWLNRPKITASPDVTHSALFDGVLASVQAVYLLKSLSNVDPSKIGVAGASWGGYIATMVAGVINDDIAATWSVFGSGNFMEGAYEKQNIEKLPEKERKEWIKYLDPGSRAHKITKPYFIATGTNDRYWSWMAVEATLADMKGATNQAYSPNSNHRINNPGGSAMMPFMNQHLKGGQAMPQVIVDEGIRKENEGIYIRFHITNSKHAVNQKVYYTYPSEEANWIERKWHSADARQTSNGYEVTLPIETKNKSVDLFASFTECNPDLGQDSTTVTSRMISMNDVRYMDKPLDVARLIGDRLIRTTPFKYRLEIGYRNKDLNSTQCIDFGRTFGLGDPGVAYAYTIIDAHEDMTLDMQLEHNDGCKIWVNKQMIYEKNGDNPIELERDERSVEMTKSFRLPLKKGKNELLIKSETSGKEWRVYMQPPSGKGAVQKDAITYPQIGLNNVEGIDKKIADLTNWLVIGPFLNPKANTGRDGLNITYPPEQELRFGYMYEGAKAPVTWTIPKIDVLGNLIDPLPWGTNYNWNYHNGGVAWAMQHLSEVSGEMKYADYAADFCEFQLRSIPFVTYQVETLNAFESANHLLVNTLLLDFTLAPALPFIYRLRTVDNFAMQDEYKSFIGKMNDYAKNGQIRLPGENIYTRTTPKKYTTWVDDMFMGIPYLIQASEYTTDKQEKKVFLEDAVRQIKGFNTQVWNEDANLYMHARYFGELTKLPHWSRANGWGIWAVCEVLSVLPKNHPEYKNILKHYRTHVESLVKLQDKSGFWFNVLDAPDSPKEVSGTAIFTMAIARGIINGWLPANKYLPVVMKSWNAIKSSIEPDGAVHDICYGTMCTEDIEYYKNRPFYDNDTHGLFAVMFAAMEVHKMLESN